MSVKAVVVGAGSISNAWFPHLIQEKVDIPAVVDLKIEAAQAQIKKFGLKATAYTKLEAALEEHQPDFVIDLTIPEAHHEVTITALQAGYPVLGEKPMAANMDDAKEMVRVSNKTGKMYAVSQSRRWEKNHDILRRTIESGVIGKVTTIKCDFFLGAHFGGFRDEMPSPLLLDMAIHHFDMARFFTGADPIAVYAKEFNPAGSWYKGDASASCIFEMTDDIVFTYVGSWCSEGCNTSWSGHWRVIGEEGTLMYELEELPYGEVVEPGKTGFVRPVKKIKVADSPLEAFGMHGAICEMIEFIKTGKTPQTECNDNIKSLAMVFAAVESSKKKQRIVIDL